MRLLLDTDRLQNLICNIGNYLPNGIADVEGIARRAKARDYAAMELLAAAFARVAFITPEAARDVHSAFTRGWLGTQQDELTLSSNNEPHGSEQFVEPAGLPSTFWNPFWSIVHGHREMGAAELTTRVAALGPALPSSFYERAEAAAHSHPRLANVSVYEVLPPYTLALLGSLPEGSLGNDFCHLLVDNSFDVEVLERNCEEIQFLPPLLRCLSIRILQVHDLWHITAGFWTTSLHEHAISSFQLEQFGHHYSAMYLAVSAFRTLHNKNAFLFLQQVAAEAWRFSTRCPAFMEIVWEDEWHKPVADIRRLHGIPVFDSIYEPELIEHLFAGVGYTIFKAVERIDPVLRLPVSEKLGQVGLKLHMLKYPGWPRNKPS
ncbi:MAG TPA: Coq4 family protein [Terriglobia bacterium]|nr:Coq4 family protein [Terriglobia bacterium]